MSMDGTPCDRALDLVARWEAEVPTEEQIASLAAEAEGHGDFRTHDAALDDARDRAYRVLRELASLVRG